MTLSYKFNIFASAWRSISIDVWHSFRVFMFAALSPVYFVILYVSGACMFARCSMSAVVHFCVGYVESAVSARLSLPALPAHYIITIKCFCRRVYVCRCRGRPRLHIVAPALPVRYISSISVFFAASVFGFSPVTVFLSATLYVLAVDFNYRKRLLACSTMSFWPPTCRSYHQLAPKFYLTNDNK
jgi:hypothetical protein